MTGPVGEAERQPETTRFADVIVDERATEAAEYPTDDECLEENLRDGEERSRAAKSASSIDMAMCRQTPDHARASR